MISEEEVKHIAKLARLELSEREIKKMQKDLSAVLDYFDLLKKAPKPEIGKNPLSGETALREDNVISQEKETVKKLIASAPDKQDDLIKVKTVF